MSSENAKAKALLEQAGDMLSEAYDLAEDGTDKHDTIGSACDDLGFVMHQMWPNEKSEPWQDGSDPMDHAVDCFLRCREVATCGDGAPSTGIVCEAMVDLNKAFILLWGDRYTAELASRRNEADKRKAEADIEEEERLFSHRIDRAIDEAKYRAKVTAPQSAEEAADNLYDVVNDVATALVAMRLYEDVDTEYYGQLFGSTLVKAARALHYLNGGTFADREEQAEGIDTLEATDQLTNAMLKRASEFPIASRADAIDALMDAAASTAALVGALLAVAGGTEDEKAHAALIRSSKEAGNANMQTLRTIGYLNRCNAKSEEEE